MPDAQHNRYNVAGCLRAALKARAPLHREVQLSMALSWLSLARRDEAMDNNAVGHGSTASSPDVVSTTNAASTAN